MDNSVLSPVAAVEKQIPQGFWNGGSAFIKDLITPSRSAQLKRLLFLPECPNHNLDQAKSFLSSARNILSKDNYRKVQDLIQSAVQDFLQNKSAADTDLKSLVKDYIQTLSLVQGFNKIAAKYRLILDGKDELLSNITTRVLGEGSDKVSKFVGLVNDTINESSINGATAERIRSHFAKSFGLDFKTRSEPGSNAA